MFDELTYYHLKDDTLQQRPVEGLPPAESKKIPRYNRSLDGNWLHRARRSWFIDVAGNEYTRIKLGRDKDDFRVCGLRSLLWKCGFDVDKLGIGCTMKSSDSQTHK